MLFYILVEPWAVYVKEGEFFASQGGLTSAWGESWRPVYAQDVEDARNVGEGYRAQGCLNDRVPAVNKRDYSQLGDHTLCVELGAVCGLHGQAFTRGCNACASANDARLSAKEELVRRANE